MKNYTRLDKKRLAIGYAVQDLIEDKVSLFWTGLTTVMFIASVINLSVLLIKFTQCQ